MSNDAGNRGPAERHLGLLHVGRMQPGYPLPSIRAIAREVGVDHRAVARAYRVLEAEGLVEIRPGSGVYLAGGAGGGSAEPEVEGRWLGGVLLEAWSRRVARSELARLVERCAASSVRCACIESNEDHMLAVAGELEDDFSLEVHPVLVSPQAERGSIPARAGLGGTGGGHRRSRGGRARGRRRRGEAVRGGGDEPALRGRGRPAPRRGPR